MNNLENPKQVQESIPLRHKAKNGGVLVVSDWLERRFNFSLFEHICDYVQKGPDYVHLGDERYKTPRFTTGARFLFNSPSIDELVSLYGNGAINKAYKLAEERNASVVLLFSTRGDKQLPVTARFYGKKIDSTGGYAF